MKKILLLASMALAAIAFAVPAGASASSLRYEGAPIEEHREVELTGQARFEFLGTGIRCTVHTRLTTEDGTHATTVVKTFEITTETCEGFGFQYSGCEVETDKVDGLPWTVAIDPTKLTISSGTITGTLSNCFTKRNDITGGTISATVDNTSAIHSVTLSGGFNVDTDSETIPAVARGTLEVVGEDSGKYSIVE